MADKRKMQMRPGDARPRVKRCGSVIVLYDPDLVDESWLPECFDPAWWSQRGSLQSPLGGRGSAWEIDSPELSWVLRAYCRGGLIRHFSYDHYLWLGLQQTRSWREWWLLYWLFRQRLPVPRPIAAMVARHGYYYTAALITRKIEAVTLAEALAQGPLPERTWFGIGENIRHFHGMGIDHADLNAHNILLDSRHDSYLLDFDKSRRRRPKDFWRKRNLRRLKRSLLKLRKNRSIAVGTQDWQALLEGYGSITCSKEKE